MNQVNQRGRIPILGVALILVGIVLLLETLNVWQIGFWNVIIVMMIIYGAFLVIKSFSGSNRNSVFWGSVLFLFGIYYFLTNLSVIDHMLLPAIFLIFGFSFLMAFIFKPADWHLLIPALFLLGVGLLIVGEQTSLLRGISYEKLLLDYWPIVLILMGSALILKSRRRFSGH